MAGVWLKMRKTGGSSIIASSYRGIVGLTTRKRHCDRREMSKFDLREDVAEDVAEGAELCFRCCSAYCCANVIAALFFWNQGCSTRKAFGAQISDGIGHVTYQ
jgi:hypothetical protein